MPQFPSRVRETTTTSGQGTVTLVGVVSGYQAVGDKLNDGEEGEYLIIDGDNWETGLGTYTASGTTLSRDTVYDGSSGTTKISLSGASADVWIALPGDRIQWIVDTLNHLNFQGTFVTNASVVWDEDLDFIAVANLYCIDGFKFSAPITTVTLDAADASNPRIDLIVATDSGTITKVTGTAAATPVAPDVPDGQVKLRQVTVAALATEPQLTTTVIYDEDDDWTTTSDGTWTDASTNDAHNGTKSMEFASAASSDQMVLDAGSGQDISDIDTFEFFIKSGGVWPGRKKLRLQLLNASDVVKSNNVIVKNGTYGFDSSNTTDWQPVSIPKSAFNPSTNTIQKLKIEVRGGGATISGFIDDLKMHEGTEGEVSPHTHVTADILDLDLSSYVQTSDIDALTELDAIVADASLLGSIDEDDMTSDSATKVPTQQSVKAYVDDQVGGAGVSAEVVTATSKTMVAGTRYFIDSATACTLTLPETASVDDWIEINGNNDWNVSSNASAAGQKITHQTNDSQTSSSNVKVLLNADGLYDVVRLFCTAASGPTVWETTVIEGSVTEESGVYDRAIRAGGRGISDVLDYWTIASLGNATDFGDSTQARQTAGGIANSTRGVIFAGNTNASACYSNVNTIDYVTLSSVGDAADFGDAVAAAGGRNGCGSATRGISLGRCTATGTIDYITIDSLGNASDFGDLTLARNSASGISSSTRAIAFAGSGSHITIDYVTIASLGNATDFGDTSQTWGAGSDAGCGSATRGISFGADSGAYRNYIDYLTIASAANATDFGDCSAAAAYASGESDLTKACRAGGGSFTSNIIETVVIQSTGNATDFGDLTEAIGMAAGLSGSNGGLQ